MNVRIAQTEYRNTGGADRVTTALARCFDAPIVTETGRGSSVPPDIDTIRVAEPLVSRLLARTPIPSEVTDAFVWSRVEALHDADVIIGSGLAPGWYIPMDRQVSIQYIHATPRAQTDRFQEEIESTAGLAYALGGRLLYSQRPTPDRYVVNSELTERRLNVHWGVDSDRISVVYPPVAVDEFSPETDRTPIVPDEEFYLVLSRLHHLKRIDEVVEAFTDLDETLVVAGDGPDEDRLKRLAGESSNIVFTGRVSEEEKSALMTHARALFMNTRSENFGIVPIEAMAAGTPVLGVDDGFTRVQISDGENGYTYERGVEHIAAAVREFSKRGVSWSPAEISAFADRFGVEAFRRNMRRVVDDAVERAEITGSWE